MNFLIFLGIVFLGIAFDRYVWLNDNLWGERKKSNKRGNYYVK